MFIVQIPSAFSFLNCNNTLVFPNGGLSVVLTFHKILIGVRSAEVHAIFYTDWKACIQEASFSPLFTMNSVTIKLNLVMLWLEVLSFLLILSFKRAFMNIPLKAYGKLLLPFVLRGLAEHFPHPFFVSVTFA